MRRSCTLSLLLLAVAACGGSKSTAPTIAAPSAADVEPANASTAVLTGTLVGWNGDPMKQAHVTVGQDKVQVEADGRFEVRLPADGFQRVMFTGVDHGDYKIGLLLDGKSVHVDVQLGTYQHPESFSAAQVVQVVFGADGNVDLGKTYPMLPDDNGLLVAVIEDAGAKEFAYEIRGITSERGRSMNSTEPTAYRYDGDGNYANVVTPKGKELSVSVDRTKLSPSGRGTVVTFRDDDTAVARVSAVYEGLELRRRSPAQAADVTPNDLLDRIETERDDSVRGALMVVYFAILPPLAKDGEHEEHTVDLAKRVVSELPAGSPLWGIEPGAALRVAEAAGSTDETNLYVEEVVSSLPDDEQAASTLFGMMWRARSDGREDDVERYYALMMDRYGETRYARLADMFDPNSVIRPGADVPAFELASFDDSKVLLSNESLKGKTVLIDFWATWCGPCVEEMPNLHEAFHKYKEKGFTILSINVDDSADNARKFRKSADHPMPWNNVVLEGDAAKPVKEKFEVAALPTVMLIGPDGKLIATGSQLRGGGLESTLAKHFAK